VFFLNDWEGSQGWQYPIPYLPIAWSKYLAPLVENTYACWLWLKQPKEQSRIATSKVNETGSGRKYRETSEFVSAFMCIPCPLCITVALK